jgi:UDP:flavonoid glycosyltransferase YjiC (YdhE family)
LGVHIPVKRLTSEKLMAGIHRAQSADIARNVMAMGERIRKERGTERAVEEIERYFNS